MKTKLNRILFAAISLSLVSSEFVHSQTNDGDSLIDTIKSEDTTDQFYRCYDQIRRDSKSTEDAKAGSKIRLLSVIHQFLKENKRPEGAVYSNMRPPDGSMSGIDPKSIKDPAMREKYQKMLDENKALGDAQMKHDTLSRLEKEIAEYFAVFIESKPEKLQMVSEEIHKNSKSQEEGKELMNLIDRASVEKRMKTPTWPEAKKK